MSSPSPATADSTACLLKLAPFVQGRVRRGIVGSSRYAQRLRDDIRKAAADARMFKGGGN